MAETPTCPEAARAVAAATESPSGSSTATSVAAAASILISKPAFEYEAEEPRIEKHPSAPSFSVIWDIISSLRPGMSVISIPLPAYLLEPRSFLEKPEPMAHCHFLNEAAHAKDDPLARICKVLAWAISAWYLMPKTPKKPANPVLGEVFRSRMRFDDGTDMCEVREQVSHHPPITAIFGSNRQVGWTVNETIGFDPVFLGLSVEARFIGGGHVHLTQIENEEYLYGPIPTASASGFFWGPLTLVFCGDVWVECKKTGYRGEFNLKSGKGTVTLNGTPVLTLKGRFDDHITMASVEHPEAGEKTLFKVDMVHQPPMQRYIVPFEHQKPNESARVWKDVIAALIEGDTAEANKAKVAVEEAQRVKAAARKEKGEVWVPKFFEFDPKTEFWNYKYANHTPIDRDTEVGETEVDGVIKPVYKVPRPDLPLFAQTPTATDDPLSDSSFACPSEKAASTADLPHVQTSPSSQ